MGKAQGRPSSATLRAAPPPLPPPLSPPPVVLVGPPIETPQWALKSVPPPVPIRDDYAGQLTPQSTMIRLFYRFFERVRTMQQLRGAVALARVSPTRIALLDQARINKYVVSTYKLVGFAVLTVIVLALVSYLGANVFYWVSSSWIEPTVVAPTDERVLSLSTQLLQQMNARDKIAAELADAERLTRMHEDFLEGARKALQDELADRKGELTKLLALDRSFASTRAEVSSNGRAYSSLSKRRLQAEYGAHFIDREAAVTGAMQLSQIAQGNLSLAEKEVELYKRRAELSRETAALGAIVGHAGVQTRHSIEVLKILQDVKRAEVELAKARDDKQVLQKSLARYDHMVQTLSDSPFIRAVTGKGTIAFVPYDNLDKVKPGAPLYACAIGPLFCKRVGAVVAVLAGEMACKHPLHNTQLRGQPVQVQLDDARDAERKVLFAGGRPVLF